MADSQSSITFTAYRVMFYVALEQYLPQNQRIIQDDLARLMLPDRLNQRLRYFDNKLLREGFLSLIELTFPGMRGMLCRKRYIEDRVLEAVASGFDSVVILGSGLDTLAYRAPQLSAVRVYEVDLPQTIAYKDSRLRQLFGHLPEHVRLVPIDFDHQALGDVLEGCGYSGEHKSFFVWEGVTQYLSEAAVRAVFNFLAGVEPGSRLAFTFIRKDFIDGQNTYGLQMLYQQVKAMWRFGLQPSQVPAFLGEYSWQQVEQLGAAEYRQRYLDPLGRREKVLEIERMVYAEKAA